MEAGERVGWVGGSEMGCGVFPFGGVVGLVGRRKNLRYRITSPYPRFRVSLRMCRKLEF